MAVAALKRYLEAPQNRFSPVLHGLMAVAALKPMIANGNIAPAVLFSTVSWPWPH